MAERTKREVLESGTLQRSVFVAGHCNPIQPAIRKGTMGVVLLVTTLMVTIGLHCDVFMHFLYGITAAQAASPTVAI